MTVVAGRLFSPRQANEAVMNAQTAREWGLHVGSAFAMPFYSGAQANNPNCHDLPYKIVSVKIVGLVIFANTVVQDDVNALGSGVVMISPNLNNELSLCCAYYSGAALQPKGGATSEARVRAEIAKATPLGKLAVGGGPTPTTVTEQTLRAIKPEAVALGIFAAIASLALALIASVRQRRRDRALLKTLGFTRRQLASVVDWPSGVDMGLGTVVGLPIGVVRGRMLWNLFAHEINAVPRAIAPVSPTALVLREE